MLPTAYPIPDNVLHQLWQTFIATGKYEKMSDVLPDPAVIQSWRRCTLRLSPDMAPRPTVLKKQALTAVLNNQQAFVSMATPFLEDIYQFIEGSDCAVILADGSACVLQMVGDDTAVTRMNGHGWGQGAYWSEGQLGTNALGMCLHTAMPVQVVGAEHYFAACHDMVTTAAPIHAVNGRIIGIIAVIGPVSGATSHTLSLVMAVARALSNHLHMDWLLEETNRHLSEVNALLASMHEGVVVWNDDGQITHVNQQAADMLSLDSRAILGQPLQSVLILPKIINDAVVTRVQLNDVETHIVVGQHAIPLMVNMKPIVHNADQIQGYMLMIRPIAQVRQLVQQQVGAQASITLDNFSGQTTAMKKVLRQAATAGRGNAPVLLRGEGGVGKNLLAHAIHNNGLRASQAFLAVNCRAVPHNLMTREFLGYEGNAQNYGRPSKFELADGGTLLLDQIECLSLEMQAALLHVIETGHILRLDSTYPIQIDTRIMATTAVNLEAYVTDGRFLPQLYYRFGVFNITIPPLRQRVDDISVLAERYLERLAKRDGRAVWIDDEAMDIFRLYPWPGNVRELESTLEWAINQSQGDRIGVADLPSLVRNGRVLKQNNPQPQPLLTVSEMEREVIMRAGWNCQGRVSDMAKQLGIGRTTLWRKMKRFNISPKEFKGNESRPLDVSW